MSTDWNDWIDEQYDDYYEEEDEFYLDNDYSEEDDFESDGGSLVPNHPYPKNPSGDAEAELEKQLVLT